MSHGVRGAQGEGETGAEQGELDVGVVQGGQGSDELPDALHSLIENLPLKGQIPHWSSQELEATLPQLQP